MNRKKLLLIGILSLILAGVVTVAASRRLRQIAMSNQPVFTHVVVAAADLSPGSRVAPSDVRLSSVPDSYLPEGTFHGTADVVGRGVIVPIRKNELVLANKVAAAQAGAGLPSLIPNGKRALSVQVNEVISVAGFVVPGAHVDVLLTGRPMTQGTQDVMTTTVLENVEVLAAGQEWHKNPEGKPQAYAVITLLVTPDEAQRLTLASSEGRIQLSLRNPLDGDQEGPKAVKSAALYHMEPAPVVAVATRPRSPGQSPVIVQAPLYSVEMIRGDKRDVVKF
jgi:pilus assembly protein CpaB